MTKEDYITMKEKGQFTLPFFYQYYVENIEKSQNRSVIPFGEFETFFAMWFQQVEVFGGGRAILDRCKEYFDKKFEVN